MLFHRDWKNLIQMKLNQSLIQVTSLNLDVLAVLDTGVIIKPSELSLLNLLEFLFRHLENLPSPTP